MGRSHRQRPVRLAEKLLQVRQLLSLSQSQMLKRLGAAGEKLHAPHISEYESGKREPPLQVLLGYARAAGIPIELLIDDVAELPVNLPDTSTVWVMDGGQLWERKRRHR